MKISLRKMGWKFLVHMTVLAPLMPRDIQVTAANENDASYWRNRRRRRRKKHG